VVEEGAPNGAPSFFPVTLVAMATRDIRLFPDPVLRERASLVAEVDDDLRRLIADMGETMRAAPGIGLAAPQVGIQRRVLVYSLHEEDPIVAVINPEVVERDGEVVDFEGCLSIPGLSYEVARAQRVVVKGIDENGEPQQIDASDLEARVLQHEIDHLDGILFIDRIDPELRKEAMKQLREAALSGTRPAQTTGKL
jgi:peptide deformylase